MRALRYALIFVAWFTIGWLAVYLMVRVAETILVAAGTL